MSAEECAGSGFRPVRFELVREEDVSGVSGAGTVAFGTFYPSPNGRVALAWMTDVNSVAVYDSIDDVLQIHGHKGRTVVRWIDDIDSIEADLPTVAEQRRRGGV